MTTLSAWKIAALSVFLAFGVQAQETDASGDATPSISKPNDGRAGSHRPIKGRGIQRHGPAAGFGNPPELVTSDPACDPNAAKPCPEG